MVLFGDLIERRVDAFRIGQVGADAQGLAAGGVDFLDEGIEVGCIAREKNDGICLCEASGNGGALWWFMR